MADAPEMHAPAGGKDIGALLKQKVGPLPLGIWVLAGIGVFWYVAKGKGSSGSSTDPAGNVGTIDPATGYVYGSTQDKAALSAGSGSAGSDTGSSAATGTGSGSTTAGVYSTNGQWASAAINYLVGVGVDPTQANEAIQQYLSSQTLTSAQQGDVNLAIQALGSPPEPPGPVGQSPGTVVTPPDQTVYATNPPTGLITSGVTSSTVTLKWNATTNAQGYKVAWGTTAAATGGSQSVDSSVTTTTITGLAPSTLYYFQIQATPAKTGAPFGSTSTNTVPATQPSGPSLPSTPAPVGTTTPSAPAPAATRTYSVISGDTLYGIARKLGIDEGGLYSRNKDTIEATAKSHGYSSSDNGHWIFPGKNSRTRGEHVR